jgi:hypothetical protein
MAIDQSTISLSADAQIKKATYGEIYCSTQGTCPNGWQIKLAENYPLAHPPASADTLAPSEKVPDMRAAAPVPEADLKHNGERSGVHGAAIVAAVTGQAIANPSPQMREAQASLPSKVKAEARKTRLEKLRQKHGHHYHDNAHHVGHHKRDAEAARNYRTTKATRHQHVAPPVIVARPAVIPEAVEPKPNPFLAFLKRNADRVVARWDREHKTYA